MKEIWVNMSDMLPLIKESITVNGSTKIRVTGWSMQPMVYHRRDSATLIIPPERLKKHDVPFYVRDDGTAILHRIIKVCKDGSYVCRGDNQWQKEYGIRRDQIVGVIADFTRNGKTYNVNKSFGYWLYSRTWVFFHIFKPLYKYIMKPLKKRRK